MATCTECGGEGTRLGRYEGVAGCETKTIVCPDCSGGFTGCEWCGEPCEGEFCNVGCRTLYAAADADDAQDRADDIRVDEQRAQEG